MEPASGDPPRSSPSGAASDTRRRVSAAPWWQTLPGALTAFAGVIATIAVLSTVLREPTPRSAAMPAASAAAVAASAAASAQPAVAPVAAIASARVAAASGVSYLALVHAPDGEAVVRGVRDDKTSQIAVLPNGTPVQVVPSDDTWQQVRLEDGRTGYMHRTRLQPAPLSRN